MGRSNPSHARRILPGVLRLSTVLAAADLSMVPHAVYCLSPCPPYAGQDLTTSYSRSDFVQSSQLATLKSFGSTGRSERAAPAKQRQPCIRVTISRMLRGHSASFIDMKPTAVVEMRTRPLMAIGMGWQTMKLALTALLAPARPRVLRLHVRRKTSPCRAISPSHRISPSAITDWREVELLVTGRSLISAKCNSCIEIPQKQRMPLVEKLWATERVNGNQLKRGIEESRSVKRSNRFESS